jgi:cytochrome c oxidase subunit 2
VSRGLWAAAVIALLIAAAPAAAQDTTLIEAGRRAFTNQGCHGCHTLGRVGTPIGPDLSHVGAKYPQAYFERWLRDPTSVRPSAHMPLLELSDDDIRALAVFFASQR